MIMPAALSSSSPTAVDMFTTTTLIRVSYGPPRKRASQTLHDHSSSASETQPCGGVFIHSYRALGQFWKAEVGSVSQAPKSRPAGQQWSPESPPDPTDPAPREMRPYRPQSPNWLAL